MERIGLKLLLKCSFLFASIILVQSKKQPHIIFLFADDLGWNDVSFHGSPQIPTPNIDALAMSGITLNNYYGMWLCTPSRGALLTGKHPIRLGLQHFVLLNGEASGLPLSETTLAERLKDLGYATHIIGKWHMGYETKEYTPTYRGFDSFYGYYNGLIDHYGHTHYAPTFLDRPKFFFGLDMNDGLNPVYDSQGKYTTQMFTQRALDILEKHNASQPLFLYFSHAAVHLSDRDYNPQAPMETINKFMHIDNLNRRTYAAMMSELDTSVGQVFAALNTKGMLDDSIIVFVSDNGALTVNADDTGSNYPLRGCKNTVWEGGNRIPAVVWSPRFRLKKPRISKGLMHVTDWMPTLYRVAGGDSGCLDDIDGMDMWDTFTKNTPSPRKNLLYNIDPIEGVSAYRDQHMKIVNGTSNDKNSWYGMSGTEDNASDNENDSEQNTNDTPNDKKYRSKSTKTKVGLPNSMDEWVFKNGSVIRDIMRDQGWWIVDDPDRWYRKAKISCSQPPPKVSDCNPDVKPCLFNVTEDPCEYYNMAEEYPDKVQELMSAIEDYVKVSVPPQAKPADPNADPLCHNFTYAIWKDPDNFVDCTYAQKRVPQQSNDKLSQEETQQSDAKLSQEETE